MRVMFGPVNNACVSLSHTPLSLLAETFLLVDSTGSENSSTDTDTDSDSDATSNEHKEGVNSARPTSMQTQRTGFSQRITLEVFFLCLSASIVTQAILETFLANQCHRGRQRSGHHFREYASNTFQFQGYLSDRFSF